MVTSICRKLLTDVTALCTLCDCPVVVLRDRILMAQALARFNCLLLNFPFFHITSSKMPRYPQYEQHGFNSGEKFSGQHFCMTVALLGQYE